MNMSHPPSPFSTFIELPKQWVECPLCGLHYVVKGREHRFWCSMIDRAWAIVSTK